MTTYNTNLASEFYVLSMLHRLGAEAYLTLGNKKAVDIVVTDESKTVKTVEVKGVAGPYDWPANNIDEKKNPADFYVLVSFEGKIEDMKFTPSVWIIPGEEISQFKCKYKTRCVISRAAVKKSGGCFLHAWSQITKQPQASA